MDELFFAKENFEKIKSIVDKNTKLENVGHHVSTLVFETMTDIYGRATPNDTVNTLSEQVVRTVLFKLNNVELVKLSTDAPVMASNSRDLVEANKKLYEAPNESLYVTQVLDVSSSDRHNWSLDSGETPYNFSVLFGASETYGGIRTEVTFKNVVKFELKYAILPNINHAMTKYPFLYLLIEEFPKTVVSTSSHGNRSFVKLIRDKHWESTGIEHFLMIDKSELDLKFETPISSLQKLTFRILSPRGHEITRDSDCFSVTAITDSVDTIDIEIDPFLPHQFSVGNLLNFQVVVMDNAELSEFLLGIEHEIVEIDGFTLKIPKKEVLDDTNVTYPTYSSIGLDCICFFNASHQVNFSFHVTSKRHTETTESHII